MSSAQFRAVLLTAFFGAVGAAGAWYVGAPAPYLIGPALVVMLAGLAGLKLAVPNRLRDACFVLVGISMGASVTPDIIGAAKRWPFSFFMVLVMVVVLLYVAAWILQHLFRLDRKTALLASSPGHLSFIISLSADSKADVPAIAIIQSVRVMALTLAVPPILSALDMAAPGFTGPQQMMELPVLAVVLLASVALGLLFTRWNFPAALLLGGLAASALPHVSGFISGQVPYWIMNPVYVVIGSLIGTRFSGVSVSAMRTAFIAGAITTVVVTIMAAACAALVSSVIGVPFNAALIAFAPGGLETMAAMAVIMHVDTTYVGSHHVLRLIFLSFLMPWAMSRLQRNGESKS
ncbi:AbrB family transcriptional regulator [Rhizobiaceae bacterium BDR2-2]|uniref:AbrB family transcriptional regulator n=1 Tax=Ectorhizobium quercum TaxID=2965071 RepID=A0AAE3N596_9HYPH|nr:AbrB family transcriptional regulator [Ectorhizobium quercum]MCX8996169.1 AbrB family transcriptional regulator [Ectorhizobium quercum]MCX8998792.1 AbrB family transcriptional regulator [Ectorhizobium quercum]